MSLRRTATEVCVSMDSRPEHLVRLRAIVGRLAAASGMSKEEIQDATLAMTEACANAMKHGSPNGSDGSVSVKLISDPHKLVVEVTDNGLGFDVDTLADPLPEKKSGGLGIALMKSLADDVEFLRSQTGMTVRLVKKIGGRIPHGAAKG